MAAEIEDEDELHTPCLMDGKDTNKKVIQCSCGLKCGPRELYFHHLEATQSDNKSLPRDASLWPMRFLKTIPNISLVQRGCIARNSEYDKVKYIVIWLNRMQNENEQNLTFSQQFIDKSVSKLKSFIINVPLQSTKDSTKPEISAATMIALSNDLWKVLIDKNKNIQFPKELTQFKSKYSYIDTNQCILPIYEKNYKFNKSDDNKQDEQALYTKTQPDIFIMIKANDTNKCNEIGTKCMELLDKDIISHIEETEAFKYKGGKDLTGFIDGTKNMDYNLRDLAETVLIRDKQNLSGSYVYCSRFIHDLAKFKKLATDAKSAIIGRKYGVEKASKSLDGRIENPRTGPDLKGHVFKSWGEMYRQSYPYQRLKIDKDNKDEKNNDDESTQYEEKGLFFAAWSHSIEELDTSLERMMGKWGTGKQKGIDNLFKITRSIFNAYFYSPSLKELLMLLDDDDDESERKNELNEWMNVKYNLIENKCVIPEENYIANKFIQQVCKVCDKKQSVLSDDESEIFFCLECRNVGVVGIV